MAEPSYGFWARALHRLALASNAVAEASFDIESAVNRVDVAPMADQPHVFVAGLARAGTTILMRELYQTGAFRSLTYRDMPFVLAPNLWGRISRLSSKDMAATERAHGDGIAVDFDSPEALEEVFWRVTCGGDYIRPDRLVPMRADEETEQAFRRYVALVLKGAPGQRYLSKNNNNILRLDSLVRCFPQARLLIPFRAPLQHAASLLRQHHNFVDQQRGDAFVGEYMTWLVHHEFGPGHRPFVFDPASVAARAGAAPTDLAYWLHIWADVYRAILDQAPAGSLLVSYERLCGDEGRTWQALCKHLDLPPTPPAEPLRLSQRSVEAAVPHDLRRRAAAIHDGLIARAV